VATVKIDGGCHCGYITYEAEADPAQASICHCSDCQVLSGTAFRTVIRAEDGSFKLLSGEPTIYVKTADSGRKREQAFCPRCGTPIYATAPGEGPKIYSIRAGSVRQRERFVPARQIWFRSRQRWLSELASIPSVDADA
jgi:hypothetical protein